MKVNPLDLSPNYAGVLMAITNGIGAITGIIAPYLVGVLTPNVSSKINLLNWNIDDFFSIQSFSHCWLNGGRYFGSHLVCSTLQTWRTFWEPLEKFNHSIRQKQLRMQKNPKKAKKLFQRNETKISLLV